MRPIMTLNAFCAWIACLSIAVPLRAELPARGSNGFRILTEHPGLHRVTFEDLVSAGLPELDVPSASLSLTNRDRLVWLYLDDGGDGFFGPGDSFEFAAEVIHGVGLYYHPYARHNVYRLRWDVAGARHLPRLDSATPEQLAAIDPIRARRLQHLERDRLLIRLPVDDLAAEADPELWYWAKLTHLSAEPFVVELDLADADRESVAELRIGARGISSMPRDLGQLDRVREHQLKVTAGEWMSVTSSWDGKEPFLISRPQILLPKPTDSPSLEFELSVARREVGENPLVDVVMIDWLEIEYAHNGLIGAKQVELHVPPSERGGVLELRSTVARKLIVVGRESGYREVELNAEGSARLEIGEGETSVWVRPEGAALAPVAVEVDFASSLGSYENQADYLVIAHPSLLEAAAELVRLHRERGLSVELIDVQDIYDEFGAGIVSPQPIRDFVAHAYHNWKPPRPRFVLLVGDASWDTKNSTVDEANYANWVGRQLLRGDRFVARDTQDYDEALRNDRNLIPSWNYHTVEGHAASDTFYTLVDGDDQRPDLAIGRLPVAGPDEVRTIAAKIERYLEKAPFGPWRSRLLWISGATVAHQQRTQTLAKELGATGRPATFVLPGDTPSREDRARIVEAFDGGHLVTHFIGHGGRFIWRTGPPDLAEQVDLFGLDELELLQDSDELPIVLSVACYSAPFDHPSADSIGEAFVRLPNRGAIAFIGASWRNSPPVALSRLLVEALSRPGTVGEALMYVKRQMIQDDSIHLYNLLGDPAVPIAAPQGTIEVGHRLDDDRVELRFDLPPEAVGGRLTLDFLDDEGASLGSETLAADRRSFELERRVQPTARAVSVYFWNEARQIDGIGSALLSDPTDPASGSLESPRSLD